MEHLLIAIALTLFITVVINLTFAKLNIPSIIGYIIVGIAISQIYHLKTHNMELLSEISEMGIVFMMFMIGLEFSFRYLMRMKTFVFGFGFLEVFIVGSIFAYLAYIFGFDIHTSLILGYTLSLSSTAIVVKMLNVSGDINKQYGRKALGILIFQDIAVIPIMLMIEIFSTKGDIVSQLSKVAISAVILIVAMYFIGRYIFENLLTWVSKLRSEELFISTVLFIVIFSSAFAHYLGFSMSLGAFIAGVLIAETHFKFQIEADIAPFRDLLLGLFFITVGMQIDPIFISLNIHKVLLVLAVLMVIKFIVIYIIIRVKSQNRTALKVALSLMQVGEFALAVFELSKNKGLLNDTTSQILSAAVVLSMIITPFILQNLSKIAGFLTKEPEGIITLQNDLKNHIIIIGYGPLGKSVAKKLKQNGVTYVIIEHDYNLVQEGLKNYEPIYLANAAKPEILKAVNIKEACGVIVAIKNFKQKHLICDVISSFEQHINTIVIVSDKKEQEILEYDLHIDNIVNESEAVSNIMVERAMKCAL